MNSATNDVIERLKHIAIFKKFAHNDSAIEKIASIIETKTYKKDSPIIEEGMPGNEMYILNKGIVRVEKKTLEKESYTVVKLSEEMNIFFGEQALIDEDVRSASVIAETDCECFIMKKPDLDNLADKEPQICVHIYKEIAKILSSRLRKSSKDTITLFEALVHEIMAEENF